MILPIWSQHTITIDASLDDTSHTLDVKQHVLFENTTGTSLDTIYFHDWANSFSTKKSPLGLRLEENYVSTFHFEKDSERGNTSVKTVLDDTGNTLVWNRGDEVDLLYVILPKQLEDGASFGINFTFSLKVAKDTYTRYGVDKDGNYKLRYWYLSPAVYDQSWQVYSNKKSNDLYQRASRFNITLSLPELFEVSTELDILDTNVSKGIKTLTLKGNDRIKATLFLGKTNPFETIIISDLEVLSNLSKSKTAPAMRAITLDRMVYFLDQKVGPYPFNKIVISDEDTKNNPVYGLNQLPGFLSPFPTGFEYDITQFKTLSRTYLENTLLLHPRKDAWLFGALQIYLMIEYVNTYYPKMKVLGSLSKFWIIRWSHIADLEFNDQYSLLYLNMARNNIHQPLSTP
ncbi:metalloprotease, partial [Flavobacteriaceae bacterium]|nr:metalloprotease [Flavobacteriaceae bacterium]